MKLLTDIFIQKPVLATVVSLIILALGMRALSLLPIREFPFIRTTVITVTTVYTGADPEIVAGFITTPLEQSISQIPGIDYITSTSYLGVSTIQVVLQLNYEPEKAITDINTKVNAVLDSLPPESQQPVISAAIGDVIAAMYLGFYSETLPGNKITDYLIRQVQPKLQAVPGVQLAEILGGKSFAMRAWLDPIKMAAFNVTSSDVAHALASNNFIAAVGQTKGQMVTVDLTANTNLHSVEDFKSLVVKAEEGAIIRLGDVAIVSLGAQDYNSLVKFDGKDSVYIGIQVTSGANLLTVSEKIQNVFPEIHNHLPEGLEGKIVYDATQYVKASISEVERSLSEAIIIVLIITFFFLASIRAVLIPLVTIPLSLIGTLFMMYVLGYTINLLTLLAFVLSIGLVVDDAIIVAENVYRHIENGIRPFEAALLGARELGKPIIAITVVLMAVYVPIGFMGGLTGVLFTEFAFTLVGAVTVSAIVALTLSPMMCSKLLVFGKKSFFAEFIDKHFRRLDLTYWTVLHKSLDTLPVFVVFAAIIVGSIYFLYATTKSELAPQEDQGIVISHLAASPNATLDQTQLYTKQVYDLFARQQETEHIFQIDDVNSSTGGMVLKPWDERKKTAHQLQVELQEQLNAIAGAKLVAFQPPSLPLAGGELPIGFVIQSSDSFYHMEGVVQELMEKALRTGKFAYLDSDLKIDKVQANVTFDRDKAALLGLNMTNLGNILTNALSGNYINFFNLAGRSYRVIPQVLQGDRQNSDQLLNYYFKGKDGAMVPLSTIAKVTTQVVPESLNHFQQANAATITGVPAAHVTLVEALDTLKEIASELLPSGYTVDYVGESRQYETESASLVASFFFALVIIYLCLAALFESFRDPLIILISVPMSICGALIFLNLGIGGATINIYTQIGLLTLIGLISKHGILIVQFANDLQEEGKSKREAVEMAATIRLRPILMTTAAMVLGVIPLILATGAGAASRFNIGLVISTGLLIGTFLTLFMVPAMYMLLGHDLKIADER